ncbi:sialate O-acetylesterase [Roseimicrobium sp. ORNL1]|uniref:sialate O-acetylesterase n=1 Tax=Roseimicrobium sp. ORNL1 TaxID=2711231 RepID=UPI0013E0EEDE|nr:sialate O-acetylesterase [Roseimicrobium sp. ORNL1]QIF05212.1 sialate O-acetylesterase [Roseimicrobium sp. ORNL1]
MKRLLLFTSLLAAAAGSLQADVKLASVFTDNMVLQRGKPVAVWGTADAGEEVSISFAGQSKKATADKGGAWKVSLEKLEASAEGRDFVVKGKNEVTLKNVVVGEVWICSGQSNMQWSVKSSNDSDKEIADANHPNIRLFTVPNVAQDEPQKVVAGTKGWLVCTPENIPSFTGVGYFFGRELQTKLDVPIGLINTSWGGTRAEAWTSKPALEAVPSLKAIITGWDEFFKTYDAAKAKEQYEAAAKVQNEKIAQIKEENAKPGAAQKPVPNAPGAFQDQTKSQHRPAVLFNAMIAPLVPYAVKGAIWYQGESNQKRAEQYQTLLPAMIKDWRKQWGDDFSFYIVQLAGFGPSGPKPIGTPDTWAELQWAQFLTAIKTPKCGLAVANDIGDEKDIHPKNKQEVGRRLARQALVKDYKVQNLLSGGPVYGGADVTGNKIVVHFSNADGLKARDGGEIKGFLICGADRVWKPAKAKVFAGRPQVHVSSEEVKNPVAVRYAWVGWIPEANLVNKDGLPTGVFRSDKFDLSTKDVVNPFVENVAPAPAPAPAAVPAKKEEVRPAEPAKKAA